MKHSLWVMMMVSSLYGWYGDVGFELTPVYVMFNDSENTRYGYGVYALEGRGRWWVTRGHGVDVIVRDTLLVGTNLSNTWELKRLVWQSEGERQSLLWGISVGRDRFFLDEGRLLEKTADGVLGSLSWNGIQLQSMVGYGGWTEWVGTNRSYLTLTNERVYTGLGVSFPLWIFSFVRVGVAGSLDLRTNASMHLVDIVGGVQGSVGSFGGYRANLWYEGGEICLSNLFSPEPVSAWAGEVSAFIGMKSFPLQGMLRYVVASGEGSSSGWNRFTGLGKIDGPVVFAHPVANLSFLQMRFTWREKNELFLVSGVYGMLFRMEKKDLILVGLYGDGSFLGQEMALEVVVKPDPSFTLFTTGGVMLKGEAFALNRDIPLFRLTCGVNIRL
ncbi:MAG: hypothetical protein N2314_08905 [Brevinematales bacterium]|nr:hypothetical protein [Brevinematales bacterium]